MAWLGMALLVCSGCASAPRRLSVPAVAPQAAYATPQAAAEALVAAAQKGDRAALGSVLGSGLADLDSGDPVQDARGLEKFAQHAGEGLQVSPRPEGGMQLEIGANHWPFPIPMVQGADGRWRFDTVAGHARILARRIGADELAAVGVCTAYVDAQRAYASVDRDGGGVLKYAQRFMSHPGTHDGLYWPAAAGEPQSPFGPFVAEATAEGYTPGQNKSPGPHPFHGYCFHILKRQGRTAPGGRYDYVINGNMIAGFALVAWPVRYGNSGVMTFIVSHQGKIYQKDLGADTEVRARRMTEYEPDASWHLVQP
jgi:hypothetical protein